MGKPGWSHVQSPASEYIGRVEGTWGSETSQYPQEEKATAIPSVVASEPGTGQTDHVEQPAGVAWSGLWDFQAGLPTSTRMWHDVDERHLKADHRGWQSRSRNVVP